MAADWVEFGGRVAKDVGAAGTHVYMFYGGAAIQQYNNDGKFYSSSEKVFAKYGYSGFFTAKAWPLKEELESHLLYFQQVTFTGLTRL